MHELKYVCIGIRSVKVGPIRYCLVSQRGLHNLGCPILGSMVYFFHLPIRTPLPLVQPLQFNSNILTHIEYQKYLLKTQLSLFLCLIQGYKERSRKWRWWTMAILWEHPREGLQAKDLEEYWDNKELDYISLKDV